MKVAVIGGGTAGFMAAAHVTKHFPSFQLYHIYDARIPTIGVGEGTTPNFKAWLDQITGLSLADLQQKAHVTPKIGIQYENWGTTHRQYSHHFYRESYAYHISAPKLVQVLQPYVKATYVDQKVVAVESNGEAVRISFEAGAPLTVDFAFDARGFPPTLDDRHLRLTWIPTNTALIRRGPAVSFQTATRAVARPHGWIFVIPLTSRTAYGYVYNETICSRTDIEADFDQFLQAEGVKPLEGDKWLRFPNFTHRTFFDGALFKIGNAAAFLEPLEATAIAVILIELQLTSYWLFNALLGLNKQGRTDPGAVRVLNERLLNFIQAISLFVGWHYARGSAFETPFWWYARAGFEQAFQKLDNQELLATFEKYVQAGANFPPEYLLLVRDPWQYDALIRPRLTFLASFSGFSELSFAEVGRGIGYFSGPAVPAAEAPVESLA